MTIFNTQNHGSDGLYRLQFETDNREHYLFMQTAARFCVDGKRGEIVENPGWQLYTETRNGEPVAYRYGPEWVAMELMMEGGYRTPEEAKLRWLEYWEGRK